MPQLRDGNAQLSGQFHDTCLKRWLMSVERMWCNCDLMQDTKFSEESQHQTSHTLLLLSWEKFRWQDMGRPVVTDGIESSQKWRVKVKVKILLYRPWKTPSLRLPEFLDNRPIKVIRLSAWRTDRLYASGDTRFSVLLETESTSGPRCGRKD